MNKKRHFNPLNKAMLLAVVLLCFGFSFNPSYGTSVSTGESRAEISTRAVSAAGVTLVVTGPCIPVAGFTTKISSPSGQSLRDKEFIESGCFLSGSKNLFNSNNSRHFHRGQFSLRLHLVCRVLRI